MNSFPSSKRFWEFYASSIPIKSDKSGNSPPSSIEVDGQSITNTDQMADSFNKYFSKLESGGFTSHSECVNFTKAIFSNNSELTSANVNVHGSFCFKPVSYSTMDKLICKIDESSSPGVSGIPAKVLKACHSSLTSFLTRLFNDCLLAEVFPDEFKLAIVTPLFKKKGSPMSLNNYRGISSLTPLAKVFEKILAEQIRLYFEVNHLFFSGQHGFRTNHSCESALHELISKCNQNSDKRLISLLLFIDFKKAFDMIDQKLLLVKLLNYGFSNGAVHLLESYFFKREQQVRLGSSYSSFERISLGVPQGSILGPLLFLIFINDLPYHLTNIFSKLFADDTTLMFSGSSVDECEASCKAGVVLLIDWCNHNNLFINWSKTFIMFVSHRRVELPSCLSFSSFSVEVVSKFKLLGIWLDSKLNFELAAAELVLSINRKLHAIKRIFYLSLAVKIQFFKSFILPYFDYCLSLIIYFSKAAIDKISKSFYNCIFKLFKINCIHKSESDVNLLLLPLKLSSLQTRILIKLSCFAFSIRNGPHAPPVLKALLTTNYSSKYSLRENTKLLLVPDKVSLTWGDLTFKNFYACFFNKLQTVFQNLNELKFFEICKFKSFLFSNQTVLLDQFLSIFPKFKINNNLNLYDFQQTQLMLNTAFYNH